MKTYLADIIPSIQRFSKSLDDVALLKNKHWVMLDPVSGIDKTFIFRDKNELIVSKGGNVERASWSYLGNNSVLIETSQEKLLYRHGFLDDCVLVLRLDNTENLSILINEAKVEEIASVELADRYLRKQYTQEISSSSNNGSVQQTTLSYELKNLVLVILIVLVSMGVYFLFLITK